MNELAILIGLISFPGLIATIVCDKLVVHVERWTSFKYGVYTFVFGVGSYACLQFFAWLVGTLGRHLPLLPARPELSVWATLLSKQPLSFSEVVWATGIAPLLALCAVYAVNKKLINRFGHLTGISNKYGDENLFSYFLNADSLYWVYVRDPINCLSYRGAVTSFSETKEVQEIVLTEVIVYDYPDSNELYKLDSIYLSKPLGVFIIEAATSAPQGESNGRQEDSVPRRSTTQSNQRRRKSRDGN